MLPKLGEQGQPDKLCPCSDCGLCHDPGHLWPLPCPPFIAREWRRWPAATRTMIARAYELDDWVEPAGLLGYVQ